MVTYICYHKIFCINLISESRKLIIRNYPMMNFIAETAWTDLIDRSTLSLRLKEMDITLLFELHRIVQVLTHSLPLIHTIYFYLFLFNSNITQLFIFVIIIIFQ